MKSRFVVECCVTLEFGIWNNGTPGNRQRCLLDEGTEAEIWSSVLQGRSSSYFLQFPYRVTQWTDMTYGLPDIFKRVSVKIHIISSFRNGDALLDLNWNWGNSFRGFKNISQKNILNWTELFARERKEWTSKGTWYNIWPDVNEVGPVFPRSSSNSSF